MHVSKAILAGGGDRCRHIGFEQHEESELGQRKRWRGEHPD